MSILYVALDKLCLSFCDMWHEIGVWWCKHIIIFYYVLLLFTASCSVHCSCACCSLKLWSYNMCICAWSLWLWISVMSRNKRTVHNLHKGNVCRLSDFKCCDLWDHLLRIRNCPGKYSFAYFIISMFLVLLIDILQFYTMFIFMSQLFRL